MDLLHFRCEQLGHSMDLPHYLLARQQMDFQNFQLELG
jgi:hypothetical protein